MVSFLRNNGFYPHENIKSQPGEIMTNRDKTISHYRSEKAPYSQEVKEAADTIYNVLDEAVDVIRWSLEDIGSFNSPGIKATIIPTLTKMLAERGIRL